MNTMVSLSGIEEFAKAFWQYVKAARVFAFHGSMGAGKTTLISAICRQKGSRDIISSPTFSIINEYHYTENGEEKKIYHMDLYRLHDEEEVIRAGVEDCIYSGAVCLVEWPEKAPSLFDEQAVHVFIEPYNEAERRISIELPASV